MTKQKQFRSSPEIYTNSNSGARELGLMKNLIPAEFIRRTQLFLEKLLPEKPIDYRRENPHCRIKIKFSQSDELFLDPVSFSKKEHNQKLQVLVDRIIAVSDQKLDSDGLVLKKLEPDKFGLDLEQIQYISDGKFFINLDFLILVLRHLNIEFQTIAPTPEAFFATPGMFIAKASVNFTNIGTSPEESTNYIKSWVTGPNERRILDKLKEGRFIIETIGNVSFESSDLYLKICKKAGSTLHLNQYLDSLRTLVEVRSVINYSLYDNRGYFFELSQFAFGRLNGLLNVLKRSNTKVSELISLIEVLKIMVQKGSQNKSEAVLQEVEILKKTTLQIDKTIEKILTKLSA